MVAAFYFYRAFKKISDKTGLHKLVVPVHSLCPLFLPSSRVCKHHVHVRGTVLVLSLFIAEHCTERDKFLFKKYSKYLLIFISSSGTVAVEVRAGLAGPAQSLIIRACAEPQLSSWQRSSTCTFASLHEANFKCNFGIRPIRLLT